MNSYFIRNKVRFLFALGYGLPQFMSIATAFVLLVLISGAEFARYAVFEAYVIVCTAFLSFGADKAALRFNNSNSYNIRILSRLSLVASIPVVLGLSFIVDSFVLGFSLYLNGMYVAFVAVLSAMKQSIDDGVGYFKYRLHSALVIGFSVIMFLVFSLDKADAFYYYMAFFCFLSTLVLLGDSNVRNEFFAKFSVDEEKGSITLRYALSFMPAIIVSWLFWTYPRLVMEWGWGAEEVSGYTLAQKVGAGITLIGALISLRATPKIYTLIDNGMSVREVILSSLSRFFVFLVLFILLVFVVLWISGFYKDYGYYFLMFMPAIILSVIASLSVVPVILGFKKSLLSMLLGVICALLLLILLTFYQYYDSPLVIIFCVFLVQVFLFIMQYVCSNRLLREKNIGFWG